MHIAVNDGDDLVKDLFVYVGTAEDKGDWASYKSVRIAAGNTKEYRMSIGSLEAGTYTLWLTGDYSGTEVLAKQEIVIKQDLTATNFEFIGKKIENKVLQVDVTVENKAGDFIQPLYLFASTTTEKKFVYAAGTAIESGSDEAVTFYFKPDKAGTWHLWLATDENGTNVIGQDEVEIAEPQEATLSITSQLPDLKDGKIQAENLTVRVDVTNEDTNDYDEVIRVDLYKQKPGTNSGTRIDIQRKEITLEPAASTSLDFTFDNVEDGSSYFYGVYYYSKGKQVLGDSSPGYEFCYTPAVIPGDANGDGKVSITDAVYVVNYVLQQAAADFCEEAADLNGDGHITITDAVMIVNIILQDTY